MLNRIVNHHVKRTFMHYRYGNQVSNPFRTLSIPQLTKLMNSSQKKSGSFFILIYKALLKSRVMEKVRGQAIFNKEQIQFSNSYIKILSPAMKSINPSELAQILELLARQFKHRNFKIQSTVFDNFIASVDYKVDDMIKQSQQNQKQLKIIVMKWLEIAKAQKIVKKIVYSLIKVKLLTKEDCILFLQKIATFSKNQNIIVSEISLKIISYLFEIQPQVDEEILFNTFDRYGLRAKRYEEDLFKKIKSALFKKIKEQQFSNVNQYEYLLNYLKYEGLLEDNLTENCEIVLVLHNRFLKYFQKLSKMKSFQRSSWLKGYIVFQDFLLKHPYYAPESVLIMNEQISKNFNIFLNQLLNEEIIIDNHSVTLFLIIIKDYQKFIDPSTRKNLQTYLVKFLQLSSSEEDGHVVQYIRIYEHLAQVFIKLTDQTNNKDLIGFKNTLLKLENKTEELTYYETIRIRNVGKVIDFEMPHIEEVYQHLLKQNPLAVLENISRSVLCPQFEQTILKLLGIIMMKGNYVEIITAMIVSFKPERNQQFSEKVYNFWWKDNIYRLLKIARMSKAFTFFIKFIEKEHYTIQITDLYYVQELLFNLVSIYPSTLDKDNQQSLLKPINSVFQFTFWDQILLNEPNELFVFKFISILTVVLKSDDFSKFDMNIKSIEKYIDILLKNYEYSKDNLITQALEILIIQFLSNTSRHKKANLLHYYYWVSIRNSTSLIRKPYMSEEKQDLLSFEARLLFGFFKEKDALDLNTIIQKNHENDIFPIIFYPSIVNFSKGENIKQLQEYFLKIASIKHTLSYNQIFMILHLFNKYKLEIEKECYDKMEYFFLHELQIMKQQHYSEYEHFSLQFSQFDASLRTQPSIQKLVMNYEKEKKIDVVRYFYDYSVEIPEFSFIDYFKYLEKKNLMKNFFQLSLQVKSLQFFMVKSFAVLLNRKSINQLEYFLVQIFPQIQKEYQRQSFANLSPETLEKIIINCSLALKLQLSNKAIEMVQIIESMVPKAPPLLQSMKDTQSKLGSYLQQQLIFDEKYPLAKINGKYTYLHAESKSEPLSCDTYLKIAYLKQVFPETNFEVRSLFQRN